MEAEWISVEEETESWKMQIASTPPPLSGGWFHNQLSSENREVSVWKIQEATTAEDGFLLSPEKIPLKS